MKYICSTDSERAFARRAQTCGEEMAYEEKERENAIKRTAQDVHAVAAYYDDSSCGYEHLDICG